MNADPIPPCRQNNRNGSLQGVAAGDVSMKRRCPPAGNPLSERHAPLFGGSVTTASWRSGYAEDCKSLHPGSIPGEASTHSEDRIDICRPGLAAVVCL